MCGTRIQLISDLFFEKNCSAKVKHGRDEKLRGAYYTQYNTYIIAVATSYYYHLKFERIPLSLSFSSTIFV